MYNKKKIVFKENLTVPSDKAVKTASENYGFVKVWAVHGHMCASTDQGVEKIYLNWLLIIVL